MKMDAREADAKPVVHLVFGMSAAGSLRQAFKHIGRQDVSSVFSAI
jgi:hypothetical protein